MAIAPEPRLVVLREQLALARAQGEEFWPAWDAASATVLQGLSRFPRDSWYRVLLSTAGAWQAAYERTSTRLDAAIGELQAFATDGEADALRYDLPGAFRTW